jgi:DNA ligase-1
MKLPTLYSRTSTGSIQEWTIEIEDGRCRTHHGKVGGKIVTTLWTTCEATNVGRANERDESAQALFEATSLWKKKSESGCFESIADIDRSLYIEPMLAKKWEDRKSRVVYPVYSQPKLDGLRAVITANGATTRNGKAWVTIPHILHELAPLFKAHPDLVLDGELYTHKYKDDFNSICSLVKKTKPSATDLQECAAKIQFWWYDIVDPSKKFSARSSQAAYYANVFKLNPNIIVDVPTTMVCDEISLDATYENYLQDGYEGQMVRVDAPYECKRSDLLLKRKEFQDGEYLIVEICEGNGNKSGMAGYAVLQRPDGKTFRSNIKGTHSFLKELLKDAESLRGTYATCTYFNLTPDGIPRFPYVTRLRPGPGID